MLWERLQHDHALNYVCNQTDGWARLHGRGDVETRKHKSTSGGMASAFCHSASATLCVSADLCCESYLVLFFFTQSLEISPTMN